MKISYDLADTMLILRVENNCVSLFVKYSLLTAM